MVILWVLVFTLIFVLFIKVSDIKYLSKRIEDLEKNIQLLSKKIFDEQAYKKGGVEQKKEAAQESAADNKKPLEPHITPKPEPEILTSPIIIQKPLLEPEPEIKTPPVEKQLPPLPPEPGVKPAHDEGFKQAREESELSKKWRQFKENVDWEQFTGAKLFAWIGVFALFIGAGFFVKYSIDRNLIPPMIRLVIGAITGLVLIIASGRFSRIRYDIMRHALAASGIGVLYSVIFAATLYYHYISNYMGFGCLMVVSAAAFVLALYHEGIAVSILGAVGAYATPILVDTGAGNLYMLLIYLAIVNTGLFEVTRRLKSPVLLLVATSGTIISLTIGTFMSSPAPLSMTIAIVWIVNMALFSVFLDLMKPVAGESRCLLLSGISLYVAVLCIAIITMVKYDGPAPMLLITAAMSGAIILARNNRRWYSYVIPYSVLTFLVAMIWSLCRFDPHGVSWSFLLFLLYGVAGGIGPIVLIIKYGLNRSFLSWFKTFPVAVAGISLVALFKDPLISFWFWPMTLGLQALGMFVTLLFGGIMQTGILTIFLIIGGIMWITHVPPDLIGYGFFGFTFIAGAVLCLLIFLVIRRLPEWRDRLEIDSGFENSFFKTGAPLTEWMTASPAMGVFLLIAASFINQKPLNPNPGMTTMVCFLFLTLAICRRLYSQPMGMIALLSSVFAQALWMLNPYTGNNLHFLALIWAAGFFLCSIATPFGIFHSYERWKRLWMTWAVFEVFQGIFIIRAADHLWERSISGWVPLALAFIKLPALATMVKQLQGRKERNPILAFHGGVLLFYVSAIPIMLLDYGWIGLALVLEAAALLWLNRRVEHPGLRWVSVLMAPAGLFILLSSLHLMKGTDSMLILNPAVMTVAACVVALFWAVRLSPFPDPMLSRIDLPKYFLWLAVGAGFFLLNLAVADIFAEKEITETGRMLKFLPHGNMLHSIIYSIIWAGFGAILWRIASVPKSMRIAGMIILCLSTGWLIISPFEGWISPSRMHPFFNLGLLAYLPVIGILLFLLLKEPPSEKTFTIKNFFLALLLITGFIFITFEASTLFQPGNALGLFHSITPLMAVASAATWIAYGECLLLWPKALGKPFRVAGLLLVLMGILKSFVIPFRFRTEFAEMTSILNMPTLLYLLCFVILVFLTVKKAEDYWPLTYLKPRPFWGVVLAITTFCILNIEIADVFGIKGRPFSLLTYGSLAHQLGYSLGWLVYSICLLVTGIKWNIVKVRWASLILLVITSFKIFFKDLWSLGQLYRVASFIGLALVLILVSFLYQRYLSDRRKDV